MIPFRSAGSLRYGTSRAKWAELGAANSHIKTMNALNGSHPRSCSAATSTPCRPRAVSSAPSLTSCTGLVPAWSTEAHAATSCRDQGLKVLLGYRAISATARGRHRAVVARYALMPQRQAFRATTGAGACASGPVWGKYRGLAAGAKRPCACAICAIWKFGGPRSRPVFRMN